ncbi:MAG TPA: hypothetical protein VL752_02595, partial [Acidisoma sp.]|uniref:hypothetical protein n=1 Tax=Acidisoma sp. TaxID=1872115 RepID=UPI002D0EF95D
VDVQLIEKLRLAFGDDGLLILVDEYVAAGMEWLSKLNAAFEARDCQRARFCVHGLRSPSLSIGARGVVEFATVDSAEASFWDDVEQVVRLGRFELDAFRDEAQRLIATQGAHNGQGDLVRR